MKRSRLQRKTPLNPQGQLQRKASPQRATDPLRRSQPLARGNGRLRRVLRQKAAYEPGEEAWKRPHKGWCSVCRKPGWMHRHHVVSEQHVRKLHGDPWDMRNAMDIGYPTTGPLGVCDCHERHTKARQRIPLSKVPHDAIDFAEQLMGAGRARDYFIRYYRADPTTTIGGQDGYGDRQRARAF